MKLSIIFSTYNHDKYVRQAIESILMQNVDFDYEVIFLDDCSTDKTQDIILEYKDKFKNVKLLFNKKNYGAMFTSRMGKFSVGGEYVTRLEGDDYWIGCDKIAKQIKILDDNKNLIGCAHNTELYYEKKDQREPMIKPGVLKSENSINDLVEGKCYFHTSSLIWRNIFKNGYPKEFYYNKVIIGDWFLSMLYSQYGDIFYIDEIMSCYRITENGVWTKLSQEQKTFNNLRGIYVYNKIFKYKYQEGFSRLSFECQRLLQSIKKKDFASFLLYIKTFFLLKSVNVEKNKIIEKFFNKLSHKKKLRPLLFIAKIIDKIIMKFFEFLFNIFFFFDINRYFLYYKILFYRFFNINIYRKDLK